MLASRLAGTGKPVFLGCRTERVCRACVELLSASWGETTERRCHEVWSAGSPRRGRWLLPGPDQKDEVGADARRDGCGTAGWWPWRLARSRQESVERLAGTPASDRRGEGATSRRGEGCSARCRYSSGGGVDRPRRRPCGKFVGQPRGAWTGFDELLTRRPRRG